ncbi:hypothetical protein L9G74_21985, partial [Shewanella sp. C32]
TSNANFETTPGVYQVDVACGYRLGTDITSFQNATTITHEVDLTSNLYARFIIDSLAQSCKTALTYK